MSAIEPFITSVWSAYGHRFMGTDCDEHEVCLICGAMYQLLPEADDPTRGYYCANDGSAPKWCSHDTSMTHGYPGERVCQCDNGRPLEGCDCTDHNCNCLFCDS